MKIVFYSNFINHHQVPLADALYELTDKNYVFVATMPLPEAFAKNGYEDYSNKPYLLKAYESKESFDKAMKLAEEADVVILGSAPGCYLKKRLQENKLTFRYSERWFKRLKNRFMNPYYLLRDHYRYLNKPLYMLAASAYTARDVNGIGLYRKKIYKWGYFTEVDTPAKIIEVKKSTSNTISLMWCARFIDWKHPELAIKLIYRLKQEGYNICLDMYGSGEKLESMVQLAKKLRVDDIVNFKGSVPNAEILSQMRKHDIFLFTSDKAEGWGAVLNESMANGCAVVASNLIGSVPFLIKDGENGCIFESENLESLYEKITFLLDNPRQKNKIQQNALKTMQEVWNARNAAKQLLLLIKALQTSDMSLIPQEGPCSVAEKI